MTRKGPNRGARLVPNRDKHFSFKIINIAKVFTKSDSIWKLKTHEMGENSLFWVIFAENVGFSQNQFFQTNSLGDFSNMYYLY